MADHQPVYSTPCLLRRIAAPGNIWRFYTLTPRPISWRRDPCPGAGQDWPGRHRPVPALL